MSDAKLSKKLCKKAEKAFKELLLDKYPDMVGDARILSTEEWRNRGEKYCRDSLATLVIDGSTFYEYFNGYASWNISEQFRKDLSDLGLWYDMGYAWTIHIFD